MVKHRRPSAPASSTPTPTPSRRTRRCSRSPSAGGRQAGPGDTWADIPLVISHFCYLAAAARAQDGASTEIEKDLVAYHFREPPGVVGQIVAFSFPLLMAAWKLAQALSVGQLLGAEACVADPRSIMKLMEVLEGVLPPGLVNVVTSPGAEISSALATNPRVAKVAFTGETVTGRLTCCAPAVHRCAVPKGTSSSATSTYCSVIATAAGSISTNAWTRPGTRISSCSMSTSASPKTSR